MSSCFILHKVLKVVFVLLFHQTPAEYETMYNAKSGKEYSKFHGYAYDGVWVMAKALDKVLRTLKSQNDEKRFWEFDYKDKKIANLLIEAMNETNFNGVTGPVQFRGGERLGCTMHKQLQGRQHRYLWVF